MWLREAGNTISFSGPRVVERREILFPFPVEIWREGLKHVIQKRVSLGRGRVGHAGTVVPRVYACFTTIVISPPPLGGPSRIYLCSIISQCTISSAGLVGILIDMR